MGFEVFESYECDGQLSLDDFMEMKTNKISGWKEDAMNPPEVNTDDCN